MIIKGESLSNRIFTLVLYITVKKGMSIQGGSAPIYFVILFYLGRYNNRIVEIPFFFSSLITRSDLNSPLEVFLCLNMIINPFFYTVLSILD